MIAVVGLILAFVLVAIFSNRKTRLCRWRENRSDGQASYTCVYCGAVTSGPVGQPPKVCLRDVPLSGS
ncbi:hypothetical protein P775_05485 [Puniceibacterium antarcticum]|uniref:Uncharacterized protein n=1 Tax=Puniceibacterium antarcticum TaxID=1206336 RepID=A0A2G8RI78_9RHOB|nr:hypothetical protein [Puniceibacterium antarcticum]PIL21250.1 hypothetical protein P775_05485 [Puniceibacterium antarcticum]